MLIIGVGDIVWSEVACGAEKACFCRCFVWLRLVRSHDQRELVGELMLRMVNALERWKRERAEGERGIMYRCAKRGGFVEERKTE